MNENIKEDIYLSEDKPRTFNCIAFDDDLLQMYLKDVVTQRCSTLLIFRKVQINTTMRRNFPAVQWLELHAFTAEG